MLHRFAGRDDAAVDAATEALALYRAGDTRRFRNRIDPDSDMRAAAAASCVVLAAIASERDEPEQAACLLGQAEQLRADAHAEHPALQHADFERTWQSATQALGVATFEAAFGRGRSEGQAAVPARAYS